MGRRALRRRIVAAYRLDTLGSVGFLLWAAHFAKTARVLFFARSPVMTASNTPPTESGAVWVSSPKAK